MCGTQKSQFRGEGGLQSKKVIKQKLLLDPQKPQADDLRFDLRGRGQDIFDLRAQKGPFRGEGGLQSKKS